MIKFTDDDIDLCGMAIHAITFWEAAKLLRTPAGRPMEAESLGIAALANAAFAVEIALKATIACEQEIPTYPELRSYFKKEVGYQNQHNLELLFGQLSQDARERIQLYFELHEPPEWDVIITGSSIADFPRMIFQHAELDSFPKLLTHASNAFEKWRYKFESGAAVGSLTFLMMLAEAVIECLPRPFHRDYQQNDS